MRVTNLIAIVLTIVLSVQLSVSARGQATLQVDEFGMVNSEDIEARLDNALIQLNNNIGSKLQFVFSRGEKDTLGSPHRLYGLMKAYISYKKADSNRVIASFCEPRKQLIGQIWLVSADGQAQKCTPENIVITETTLFDSAPSATGKGTDFSCCIVDSLEPVASVESLRAFADLLKKYPESKAYIYSYGGTNVWWTSDSRGREKTIRSLDTQKHIASLSERARKILIQNGVEGSRIVSKNAGYRDSVAVIEMWIVPKGAAVPKISPNYPSKRRKK